MSRFKYMEIAKGSLLSRGKLLYSKDVIKMPFLKENRFTEIWRGMYLFESTTPTDENPMFGNFYIESDDEDFNINRNTLIEASRYLNERFEISFDSMSYFLTNRSIWLSIPTKVFGCFGSVKLNLIHRKMAQEINDYLLKEKKGSNLDLSIYKWNGLIHGLGSYLKKSKRWVSKFSYSDLESAVTKEDLLNAKYDNFSDLSSIRVSNKANKWYISTRENIIKNKTVSIHKEVTIGLKTKRKKEIRPCMKKLEDKGYIEELRNLHIYTYALNLKELGYSTQEATERIQNTFSNPYVYTRECVRTIKSAMEGNKQFNCGYVKTFIDDELLDNCNCDNSKNTAPKTFIVPREFISLLHSNKVHYMGYKYLLMTLYKHQVHKKPFEINLNGNKYKKNTYDIITKLSQLGLVEYSLKKDFIEVSLVYKEKSVYKNHIIIPNSFMESHQFNLLKKETKLFLELLRASVSIRTGLNVLNIKNSTIIKNIKTTKNTLMKHLNKLRAMKLLTGKFICLGLIHFNEFIQRKISKATRLYETIKHNTENKQNKTSREKTILITHSTTQKKGRFLRPIHKKRKIEISLS